MPLRVLHLVGSPVSEFYADLSRLYARGCLAATADPAAYEPVVAHVDPGGRWRFPADLDPASLAAAPSLPLEDAVGRLVALAPDVALPQLFCLPGMTTYRSLLELLGIAYVGNRPDVMALGADKVRAKAVVAAAGVRVPAGEVLRAGEQPTTSPPAVVKPADADNSFGVGLVREPSQWAAALAAAHEHSERALVETYVELGREVRCGVVEHEGALVCLPLEEYAVDPLTRPVRGYDDKIARDGDGALGLVAKEATRAWVVDVDDPVTGPVWEAARACYAALGCRDYGLFDLRVDPDGRPWFLEAGLYNSFAPTSVIPTMAAAAGITLPALLRAAVVRAVAR